jgi:hypothetical protein
MIRKKIVLLILFTIFSSTVIAEDITFSSSTNKAQLIELYTSQGCSSCPIAEHKLSQLVTHSDLWSKIIPIAFHVDYWDYLGWKDLYSNASNTQKQKQHYQLGNISNIYTPGFVVDGKEWRGFFKGENFPAKTTTKSGKLSLTLNTTSNKVEMAFNNQTNILPNSCHFALMSFDKVHIKAGENSGLALQQDFAAIATQSSKIQFKNDHYVCAASMDNIKHISLKQQKLALVGWVSSSTLQPIQATGGWL